MKSVTWNELGAAPALRDDLPAPTPGVGEALVRVHASSVNPVDNAIAAGMLKDMETWSRTISPSRSAATSPTPSSRSATP
jgi:NADPH:quinone reductase-like Zn-dependent oxidoreductase